MAEVPAETRGQPLSRSCAIPRSRNSLLRDLGVMKSNRPRVEPNSDP